MTLIINNQEVQQVLTMEDTIAALEQSYLQLAAGEAVCRPRIDIRIPTRQPDRYYQWGPWRAGNVRLLRDTDEVRRHLSAAPTYWRLARTRPCP